MVLLWIRMLWLLILPRGILVCGGFHYHVLPIDCHFSLLIDVLQIILFLFFFNVTFIFIFDILILLLLCLIHGRRGWFLAVLVLIGLFWDNIPIFDPEGRLHTNDSSIFIINLLLLFFLLLSLMVFH